MSDDTMKLEKIRGKHGSTTRPATQKHTSQDCKVGTLVNSICYIYIQYMCPKEKVVYRQTCWYFSVCKIPLFESRVHKNIEKMILALTNISIQKKLIYYVVSILLGIRFLRRSKSIYIQGYISAIEDKK